MHTENEWIVQVPEICAGSPTIKGTRIQVVNVIYQLWLALFEQAIPKVLEAYPHLTREQVEAAITYFMEHKEIVWEEEKAALEAYEIYKQYLERR